MFFRKKSAFLLVLLCNVAINSNVHAAIQSKSVKVTKKVTLNGANYRPGDTFQVEVAVGQSQPYSLTIADGGSVSRAYFTHGKTVTIKETLVNGNLTDFYDTQLTCSYDDPNNPGPSRNVQITSSGAGIYEFVTPEINPRTPFSSTASVSCVLDNQLRARGTSNQPEPSAVPVLNNFGIFISALALLVLGRRKLRRKN